ncbi:unnamed protein product [Alopecurus aequalis]
MIPRRFINLLMKDLQVGGSYWLSRLRPEENLFYSSAVEAAATEAQARRDKRKPICSSTMELATRPDFRFKSSRSSDSTLGFMPFYGGLSGGASEGRILVSDSARHTHLYDAEEGSGEILPPTGEKSTWHSPISVCIAKDNAVRADTLYAINNSNSTYFKSLAYHKGARHWFHLPLPPYFLDNEDCTIQSYTLLDDYRTICFSSHPHGHGGFGTYCFDTATLEWTKAGSWNLPFAGHALRVPQLYNLYFGLLDTDHESLVALEIPSPPSLNQWRGFSAPTRWGDWFLMKSNLMYLGNRRFRVAKIFGIIDGTFELSENLVDMVAILTGVEILNGYANKAKLQMIKHKTRTYTFDGCSIKSVF